MNDRNKHRMTTFHDDQTVIDFARTAADHFASHPGHATFGTDEFGPSPGELIALRWGSHDRAVLVVRISEEFDPVVFCDAIDKDAPMSDAMWARENRLLLDDEPLDRVEYRAETEIDRANADADAAHPVRPDSLDETSR